MQIAELGWLAGDVGAPHTAEGDLGCGVRAGGGRDALERGDRSASVSESRPDPAQAEAGTGEARVGGGDDLEMMGGLAEVVVEVASVGNDNPPLVQPVVARQPSR